MNKYNLSSAEHALDLKESLQYAAEGKVRSTFTTEPLDEINSIFERMLNGTIDGRIVMRL